MQTETENQPDTGETLESFFSKYDSDAISEALDGGTDSPENPRKEARIPEDLDPDTLADLGLTPPPDAQPGSDGEKGEDGAESRTPEVDLQALSSALGLSENDLSVENGRVVVSAKVDGEEMRVSMDELRKGYQLQSHFTRQNEAFLRDREAWEQHRQAQQQQLAQQAAMANDILMAEENKLAQEYTKDWNALRREDPAEYSAQVAEYNQKLSEIRGRRQSLMQTWQQRQAEQQQQYVQQMQYLREQGTQYLSEQLGWSDDEKRREGAGKLQKYLAETVGLQPAEIEGILDPRTLIVAEKARRFDELKAHMAAGRKKVSQAPKIPSGSGPVPTGTSRRRRVDESLKRLREDHSVESAAEVFKQLDVI